MFKEVIMIEVPNYLPHYTYDDWVNWEGRWELIDGRPIAGNPLPPPTHAWVNAALQCVFYYPLKQEKKNIVKFIQLSIIK